MIKRSRDSRIAGGVQSDKIGKVFLVVSTDGLMLRRCLICDGVFTRQAASKHSTIPCTPGISMKTGKK